MPRRPDRRTGVRVSSRPVSRVHRLTLGSTPSWTVVDSTGLPIPLHAGVPPGRQVRVQAAHARQPPGDGARRQTGLAVLQSHDPLAVTRGALGGQEREHVGRRHLCGRLGDRPEEDLQIRGHRQPRVGPGPHRHERQIVVQQRMPERDRLQLGPAAMTDQTRHERAHRLSSIGGLTMLAGRVSLVVDHPCINHVTPDMTAHYAELREHTLREAFLALEKRRCVLTAPRERRAWTSTRSSSSLAGPIGSPPTAGASCRLARCATRATPV